MARILFLMEQHIGHRTYYENLRRAADRIPNLQATWVPITYKSSKQPHDLPPTLWNHTSGTIRGIFQVWQALTSHDYDIAFFNTQVPAALAGQRLFRRPYIISTDITPSQYDAMARLYGHRTDHIGPLDSYKHRVNMRIMHGAARVLPWSNWTRDSLVGEYGVPPERVEVIPPGVDLGLWTPGEHRHTGPLRILFVGGNLYRKGGARLIEAFRALPKGSAELHIVTRTQIPPEEGIYTYYSLKPNSPHLIALYQSSDVFVLPSEAEAFGIAATEACAAGLAIIATAMGGLRDIVEEGKTGFLIPAQDSTALRDRLLQLTHSPSLRAQMGRAARAHAEQHFSAERNTARLIDRLHDAARATSALSGA